MAGFGNFTVGNCYGPIQEYLAGKVVLPATMAEWIRKSVLEFSRDYSFQGLQKTGPAVYLVPKQYQYSPDFFTVTGDMGVDISRVESLFMYYDPSLTTSTLTTSANHPGVSLRYKNIQGIENSIAINSFPSYWSRWAGQIYIAPNPDKAYLTFMRYQVEHVFPNKGTTNAGIDPILLDDDWQDIVEYAAAYRGAISTRLLDYAQSYQRILYGDPKWQASGGKDGQPGLIFRRVSQRERDSVTSSRNLVVRRG